MLQFYLIGLKENEYSNLILSRNKCKKYFKLHWGLPYQNLSKCVVLGGWCHAFEINVHGYPLIGVWRHLKALIVIWELEWAYTAWFDFAGCHSMLTCFGNWRIPLKSVQLILFVASLMCCGVDMVESKFNGHCLAFCLFHNCLRCFMNALHRETDHSAPFGLVGGLLDKRISTLAHFL